eukprot:4990629-Pyramimonas_sp.AAC.1
MPSASARLPALWPTAQHWMKAPAGSTRQNTRFGLPATVAPMSCTHVTTPEKVPRNGASKRSFKPKKSTQTPRAGTSYARPGAMKGDDAVTSAITLVTGMRGLRAELVCSVRIGVTMAPFQSLEDKLLTRTLVTRMIGFCCCSGRPPRLAPVCLAATSAKNCLTASSHKVRIRGPVRSMTRTSMAIVVFSGALALRLDGDFPASPFPTARGLSSCASTYPS